MDQKSSLSESFWKILTESGYCNAEVLTQIRSDIESSNWQPLGAILIRSGQITVGQVAGLLSMQTEEPGMRIGDLAVREGHCTPTQIRDALQLQRSQCRMPLENLIESSHLDETQLLHVLAAYLEKLERRLLAAGLVGTD